MSDLRRMVLGALVADAAALGLHWIYDRDRVREVAGDEPEFLEPNQAHYEGVPAYFVHGHKRAGDSTHYGAQLLVALESLAATGGVLDPLDYERRFVDTFGPGGSWVGYIDRPTRDTLRNVDDAERAAAMAARTFPLAQANGHRRVLESIVLDATRTLRGERLTAAIDERLPGKLRDDADLVEAAQRMARAVARERGDCHGANDTQLPAVSKLPAIVGCAAEVEAAVRVTNDNDDAVAWAHKVAALLREDIEPAELAGEGGPACPLVQAVPVCGRILAEASSFEDGVRRNLLEGGDNAGRGILVGAWLGNRFGVPEAWLQRTHAAPQALAAIERLER